MAGEFDLISRYFTARGTPRPDVLAGVGDDGAVLAVPDRSQLVVVADTIVAGVHFLAEAEAGDIGYRALAALGLPESPSPHPSGCDPDEACACG